MCGRYTLSQGEKVVEAIPNVTIREDLRQVLERGRFNIAPTQDILAAVPSGAGPELRVMRWGLIPSWAQDGSAAGQLINARAETLAQKPAFRGAFRQRRCVIPADGFYEWRKNADGSKTPFYARLKSGRGFAFAGLWETWRDAAGETLATCTIITTAPNALLSPIHNRMPAMLSAEAVGRWLAPGGTTASEAEGLLALLRPFPAEAMEIYAVSRAVNSATHEGRELVAAVEDGSLSTIPSRSRRANPHRHDQGDLF
jgi:putative SOS response-associated peptidase YedK